MSKIPAKTTLRALDAVAFMNSEHGVAFNGMVTLNFEQIGLATEAEAKGALTKLNEALADKIRRYGSRWGYDLPHYFLYVHEDVPTSYGHHVHELVVIPRGLHAEMDRWLKAWARRNYGSDVHPKAVHYGGEYPSELTERAKLQARMVRYVLKSSADCTVRGLCGKATTLEAVLEAEKHKRAYCASVRRVAGTSQNIGELEQLWAGFWRVASPGRVFSDQYLRDWQADRNFEELMAMLRKIDV